MYFDSAAAVPLDPRVKEEMLSVMDIFGNENSKHCYGFQAKKKMEAYLQCIAQVLGVKREHLSVMYSGTDANRRFIQSCRKRFGESALFCSAVEHSSIVDEIPETNRFDPRTGKNIPPHAKLIALMQANSETGAIYDAVTLRQQFPNAFILRDYAQSFAKGLFPDFENADAGTFAPQKISGPKMVGLLYLKNPELFPELSKDSHTKNLFLVAGMAKAFEIWTSERVQNQQQYQRWQTQIEQHIRQHIPEVKIHESDHPRIPGLINVAFRGVRGSALATLLSEKEGIAVSTGSACSSDILSPTRVIRFIEPDPDWQYPIRIGLHKFLTDQEVQDFCEILTHYVATMRGTC